MKGFGGVLMRLALFITMACGSHSAQSQSDFSSAVDRILKSMVVIRGNNGLGSGFIVSTDGKIVTNLHVIQGMTTAGVQLANGEIYESFSIVGIDPKRDLAVLKISGLNLTPVELGNSETLKVGQHIAVVGSPRGLTGTVTTGVLSAVRAVEDQIFLQIDAAVNPGNSGGPVVKLDGTVVGVVVSKLKGAENLNFAVPVNGLRDLLDNLKDPITLAQLREMLKSPTSVLSEAPLTSTFPREWKSLNGGASRRLKLLDDSLTGEQHLTPDQVNAGRFIRYDIKRTGNTWTGKTYIGGRCQIPETLFRQATLKFCQFGANIELTLLSPNRIEGRLEQPAPGSTLDCSSCTWTKGLSFGPQFIWVPND